MSEHYHTKKQQGAKILATISVFINAFVFIVAFTGIVLGVTWGLSALMRAGAPDTGLLARSIAIALYSSVALMGLLVLAIVFQFVVIKYHAHLKPWMWWVMLISAIFALIASVIPFNPVSLVFALLFFVMTFVRKRFYYGHRQ